VEYDNFQNVNHAVTIGIGEMTDQFCWSLASYPPFLSGMSQEQPC